MRQIDIKKLNMNELVGVVNLYPWYGGARKELCTRMSRMGSDEWGEAQFAETALYMVDRDLLASMVRRSEKGDWSDADIEKILKSYTQEKDQSIGCS